MKFTISKQAYLDAISQVQHVVSARTTLAILSPSDRELLLAELRRAYPDHAGYVEQTYRWLRHRPYDDQP